MATIDTSYSKEGIKPAELPMDISQEQMKLARKQRMIDALSDQAMKYRGDTQMAGGVAIAKSPLEALAQALTGGVLGYADKNIDEQGAELPGKLDALNRSELEKVQTLGATDPEAAQAYGQTSRSPLVRAMFEQKAKEAGLLNRTMAEKALGAGTNASVVAAAQGGGIKAVQPKAGEQQELGGIILNKETGLPSAPMPQEAQFRQGYDARGNLVQTQPQTGKMDGVIKAPTINNNMRIEQQVEKEFDKKVGTGAAEDVLALGKASRQAETTLQGISEARAAQQSGINSGMAAPFVDTLGQAAAAAGLPVDSQKLANNATYRATIASELAQYLTTQGGGGRGTTDKDMEILKQKYWKLEQTPEGQVQIMDMLERKARRNQQDFRTSVERVRKINPSAAQYLDLGLPNGPEQAQPGVPAEPRAPGVPGAQQPQAPASPKVRSWNSF